MLRGFLDLVVLHHDGFPSALGLLLARKLAEYSMRTEQLGEIARAAMAGDPRIITAAIADPVAIRTRDAGGSQTKHFAHLARRCPLCWHPQPMKTRSTPSPCLGSTGASAGFRSPQQGDRHPQASKPRLR
jgi:hypothetical protein